MLPTVVPSLVEIPSQLALQMHMDSQNFDAIIREPCMYTEKHVGCFNYEVVILVAAN